jgi:polysaccharide export outer membrane protein
MGRSVALGSFAGLVVLLGLVGCKTTGGAIPVESIPPSASPAVKEYVLQAGDTISVRVLNQEGMTTRARIRPDGRISLPFLDDVDAGGLTPPALAKKIQVRLKDFFVNPVVTVSLEEPRPLVVSVIGEVVHPGNYTLEAGSGVLQALAVAGGMTPFADRSGIYVIRRQPDGASTQRILFSYSGLTQAQGRSAGFYLQPGDAVVVE